MFSPFDIPPHPSAQKAAEEVLQKVHAYMDAHPESELHRCGKMFGVLTFSDERLAISEKGYLAAFSAKLDGSYEHEGFVPPVYAMSEPPIGTNKAESQRLQRLLFANYRFLNGKGETKNLLEIFAKEKPIVSANEWFADKGERRTIIGERMPPSGAGECCAPKLLQYAFLNNLEPIALAEFWIGAAPKNEIRKEGAFYAPCSGRCIPILRHMLEGLEVNGERRMAKGFSKPEIVYEDADLMVVNKPSGLLSVPGKTEEPSVESMMGAKPVHRLDQDTSGLLVLAKNEATYKTLQAYFQRRDILKRYEAVCSGERLMAKGEGEISLPLLPNPYDRPRQMVDKEHGKPAITRYVIREKREDGTVFVDFYPLTGRTHQLRVHAAHPEGLNAPIVGDRLYNGERRKARGERLMLHAAEIQFLHPVTGEKMHFCIPSNF